LLADGVGGYAMGKVSGLRIRRYHGLLTIAETPSRRFLAVAALDPVLVLRSGRRVPLGVHEWADRAVAPQGSATAADGSTVPIEGQLSTVDPGETMRATFQLAEGGVYGGGHPDHRDLRRAGH